MKSGQISKAWSLLSTAARMCVDLGFHRPTPGTADLDQFQSRKAFWYIFIMEKGVALTLGRPPSLRIGDVTVDTLDYPNEILGIPGKIAIAFFELATIEEEMMSQLFSASSQQVAVETRQTAARGFHERLKDAQKRIKTVSHDHERCTGLKTTCSSLLTPRRMTASRGCRTRRPQCS